MQKLLNQLIPFVLIGITVVAFAFGIMILAYLFFFGAVIGLILYAITLVREKFFPSKTMTQPAKKEGRTFDSDSWTEL